MLLFAFQSQNRIDSPARTAAWRCCGDKVTKKSSPEVSQGSVLRPALFNVLINDLDDGTECAFSKFRGGTELGGVADAPDGCAAVQRDLGRLENSAESS